MAWIQLDFFSKALGMGVPVNVLLPHTVVSGKDLPKRRVLWLLHGAYGNQDDWIRRTSIERYAQEYGLAVVMPAAHLSSYADMAHGGAFYTYISKELPKMMRAFFPLSQKREDNFIAGLSMGGFGALMIGLANPDKYAAIGCLSSGMDTPKGIVAEDLVAGDESLRETYFDVRFQALRIAGSKRGAPRVYLAIGEDDFLLEQARAARDFFGALPQEQFDFTYREAPGGHTWEFWDEHIRHFLVWLDLPKVPGLR